MESYPNSPDSSPCEEHAAVVHDHQQYHDIIDDIPVVESYDCSRSFTVTEYNPVTEIPHSEEDGSEGDLQYDFINRGDVFSELGGALATEGISTRSSGFVPAVESEGDWSPTLPPHRAALSMDRMDGISEPQLRMERVAPHRTLTPEEVRELLNKRNEAIKKERAFPLRGGSRYTYHQQRQYRPVRRAGGQMRHYTHTSGQTENLVLLVPHGTAATATVVPDACMQQPQFIGVQAVVLNAGQRPFGLPSSPQQHVCMHLQPSQLQPHHGIGQFYYF
ncbi:hypothetical protein Tb927.5.1970 [Trypanosoma brucei brucei TREU927]|uniref:T. brucei spp.-specific protein n=1 Tax=Trypanosoma brucei brucei (strain 927/4 GUTat10.1) TaxID=185431 RepID=Q57ZR6_TRYB2|nr:hypothetical protein Tb927.5.1970 [Trypanosoma brucei brucei TREU927]AAX79100.1 hypothetical protein Tb927.5.1970 [Trypanosoma brucei]AAZ11312.1 hypothetical protein Tb927.5.1970 [Trypanosoma brucei brucei TREU927]